MLSIFDYFDCRLHCMIANTPLYNDIIIINNITYVCDSNVFLERKKLIKVY